METLVLYHGTRRRFERFDKSAGEPRFSTSQWVLGHYFTESPELAMAYARGRHGKVYVTEARFEAMKTLPAKPSGLSVIESMQLNFNHDEWIAYREDLVDEGYDAVRFETSDGHSEFVFLHDQQLTVLERVPVEQFRMWVAEAEAAPAARI